MNDRKIVLRDCSTCPYIDHMGGFGTPANVPCCTAVGGRELPHTVGARKGFRGSSSLAASPTFVIPEWCPLDVN